jgi:hypothetical protein
MDKSELIGKKVVFIVFSNDGKEIHKIGAIMGFEDYMTEEVDIPVMLTPSSGHIDPHQG